MSKANRTRFELRIEAASQQYDTCLEVFGEDHYNTAFALGKLSGLLELYRDIYGYDYYNKEGNTP
jgi:hypothetical protein